MQKFFDLLATKFADAIERGFTLFCDRMEARLAHVDQPALEKPRKEKEIANGRK